MVDGDPYQRYGGMLQEITTYTDRPPRRVVVDVTQTPIRPFGMNAKVLFPDQEADPKTPSLFLAPVDGRFQVTADEPVVEIGTARLVDFGPFQQVTIKPTIRGTRRKESITYRNAADLFLHAAS